VVTKGLTGQETVVVTGQSRLAPGITVKTSPAGNPSRAPTAEASDGSASPS
jgi:hypothetical protein